MARPGAGRAGRGRPWKRGGTPRNQWWRLRV